jgi:hypothetical protein
VKSANFVIPCGVVPELANSAAFLSSITSRFLEKIENLADSSLESAY